MKKDWYAVFGWYFIVPAERSDGIGRGRGMFFANFRGCSGANGIFPLVFPIRLARSGSSFPKSRDFAAFAEAPSKGNQLIVRASRPTEKQEGECASCHGFAGWAPGDRNFTVLGRDSLYE